MKKIGKRYSRELLLLLIFLAIAWGASIFIFFITSRDVQSAQSKYKSSLEANAVLDAIADELAYAAQIDHPFDGESKECWYRRPTIGNSLEPSIIQHGFVVNEGMLEFVARDASGTLIPQASLGDFTNPLLKNVKQLAFVRRTSNLLVVAISLLLERATDAQQTFERVVCIRGR